MRKTITLNNHFKITFSWHKERPIRYNYSFSNKFSWTVVFLKLWVEAYSTKEDYSDLPF